VSPPPSASGVQRAPSVAASPLRAGVQSLQRAALRMRDVLAGPGGLGAARELMRVNVREARVPPFTLPPLLVDRAGAPVETPDAWRARRAELLAVFTREVYGPAPEGPALAADLVSEAPALDGRALRRELRLSAAGDPGRPALHLLVYRPADARAPVPVFLGLNFRGNHTVHADPGIALSRAWVPADPGGGVVDGRATEAARGVRAARWPVEAILARGHALATAYAGDLAPDHPERWRTGLVGDDLPDGAGAIAVWAWGLSRLLDALEREPGIDAARVVAFGHSRLGKAALWAAARDERFAAAVANASGCMGAALSRRHFGETPAFLARAFPHWMAPAFRVRVARGELPPVDQHQLLALLAPRPLHLGGARADRWADPRGEQRAAREAAPAWRLLGVEPGDPGERGERGGNPSDPEAGTGRVGHHLRSGGHDVTRLDWERFLDFADAWVRPAAAARASVPTP